MKNWIVYTFLFCYLFSATELSELLKVDHVFSHFKEHQSKTNNLNFSDFLYSHYVNHGTDNGDQDKDKDLPFHSHSESCTSNFSIPVVLPVTIIDLKILSFQDYKNGYSNYFPEGEVNSYLESIWQPPQSV
jgi:hypothetical protein